MAQVKGDFVAVRKSDNAIMPNYQWNCPPEWVINNVILDHGGVPDDYKIVAVPDKVKFSKSVRFNKNRSYNGTVLIVEDPTQAELTVAQADETAEGIVHQVLEKNKKKSAAKEAIKDDTLSIAVKNKLQAIIDE